jgi:hypothetical protein
MVKSLVKSSLQSKKGRESYPVEETGKNSVIPSIIARTIACNVFYTFLDFYGINGYSETN